jgi:hypothetical protein
MAEASQEKGVKPSLSDGAAQDELHAGQATFEVLLNKDGFKLHPQPVQSDPLDPLNWSFTRKHSILAIVMSL